MRVENPEMPDNMVKMNLSAIIDEILQDWKNPRKISVESTNAKRTQTGTLEEWGVLSNSADSTLQVEGRAQFFDRDEAPVEGPATWQQKRLWRVYCQLRLNRPRRPQKRLPVRVRQRLVVIPQLHAVRPRIS